MLADVVVLFLTVISAASVRYFFAIRRICGGHRGREQRDVLVLGGVGQDLLDVLGEAHLEHLVGLVEHQEAQLGQVERALLEVVHDPARGADHDVHAAAQGGQLDAVPLAAVDRQHVQARQVRGVALEGLGDLEGELAGGGEHQRLRASSARRSTCDRIGTANAAVLPVPVWARPTTWRPGEQRRDRRGLDRRRRLVADVGRAHAAPACRSRGRRRRRSAPRWSRTGRLRGHPTSVVPGRPAASRGALSCRAAPGSRRRATRGWCRGRRPARSPGRAARPGGSCR